MTTLTHQETMEGLKHVPDWTHQAKSLTRTYKFETFLLGIAFVRRIAKRAEKLQHHPDIDMHSLYQEVFLLLLAKTNSAVTNSIKAQFHD